MALNHFRTGHFRANHFTPLRGLLQAIAAGVMKVLTLSVVQAPLAILRTQIAASVSRVKSRV